MAIKDMVTASSYEEFEEQAKKIADEMAAEYKLNEESEKYVKLGVKLRKLIKAMDALDPKGERPFIFNIWRHSGKPFRKSRKPLASTSQPKKDEKPINLLHQI